MSAQNDRKLNKLERELPEGLLVDAAWLERHGYYGSLRRKYVTGGWLEQPARSVYRRPRGKLAWQQVVISLQTLLEYPVIVGGRTALEQEGFAHYLPLGDRREIHIYADEKLPGWVQKLPLEVRFLFHNAKRLFQGEPIAQGLSALGVDLKTSEPVSNEAQFGSLVRKPWGQWNWPLVMSVPERAILELLDELPDRESFHQVDMLMEGLSNLSPKRMQKLLLDCRSIKVKRLFFWFADRHQHAWLNRIDRTQIDLGKGKRMIVRGGKLDATYQITVPEDMHGDG
ncbi:MAG TPA: hypothetical protein ENJ26_02980 [Rhodobacteraceae bacterium]|nr:hypothetical protein [Paracoccaceae bacterium]